jgi:hypothetical protein
VFHVNYLGAEQPTFTLNFSKGQWTSHNTCLLQILYRIVVETRCRCLIRLRKDRNNVLFFTWACSVFLTLSLLPRLFWWIAYPRDELYIARFLKLI